MSQIKANDAYLDFLRNSPKKVKSRPFARNFIRLREHCFLNFQFYNQEQNVLRQSSLRKVKCVIKSGKVCPIFFPSLSLAMLVKQINLVCLALIYNRRPKLIYRGGKLREKDSLLRSFSCLKKKKINTRAFINVSTIFHPIVGLYKISRRNYETYSPNKRSLYWDHHLFRYFQT